MLAQWDANIVLGPGVVVGEGEGQVNLQDVAFYVLPWVFISCISILKAQRTPEAKNQINFLTQCFPSFLTIELLFPKSLHNISYDEQPGNW